MIRSALRVEASRVARRPCLPLPAAARAAQSSACCSARALRGPVPLRAGSAQSAKIGAGPYVLSVRPPFSLAARVRALTDAKRRARQPSMGDHKSEMEAEFARCTATNKVLIEFRETPTGDVFTVLVRSCLSLLLAALSRLLLPQRRSRFTARAAALRIAAASRDAADLFCAHSARVPPLLRSCTLDPTGNCCPATSRREDTTEDLSFCGLCG